MPITFEAPTADLRRIISNVLPMASTDETVPVLEHVRFRVSGTALDVAATDRYIMGTDSLTLAEPVGPLTFLLHAKGLADWLKVTAKGKYPVTPITVEDDGWVTFGYPRTEHVRSLEPFTDGVFPDIERLMAVDTRTDLGTVAYDPNKIARFGKIRRDNADKGRALAMVLTFTAKDRATLIAIGETFKGMIMPIRQPAS